jgi:hypothetical protein
MMKKNILTILIFILGNYVFAQNFSDGFNFNMPAVDSTPSVFLPKFIRKTISEAERVGIQGENFIVAGKPYRFWGVNLTTHACFPLKENAAKMATRMHKMGINLVRFHHIDNPWTDQAGTIFNRGQNTRSLNATSVDRLDYLIYEMKRNNIYANINLNVGRTFTLQDGIAGADSLKDFGKGVTIFDPQLIALQKEYARQLLTHVNPYTNTTLAVEPTVALVEIINENSLYGMWKDEALKHTKDGGNLLQRHISFLDSTWNAFLIKKYNTQAALQTAWALPNTATPVNRVENGGFESATLGANWQNELHNGAVATFGTDTNEKMSGTQSAKVQITNTTGTDWHIQFKYVNFSFKKDSNYVIKFAAKADRNRTVSVVLMRNDAPYTWHGGQNFSLTTNWQTFQFGITPTEDINNAGRISFTIGQSNGTIWLDDVSFAEPLIIAFEPNESLTSKNIRRIGYTEKLSFSKQRVADLAEFYIGLQKSFMEDMRLYLKNELGVKASITGTNALTGIQEGMEHENMDFYDDHNYWDHPQFPGTAWDSYNWLLNNNSAVKDPNGFALTTPLNGIALADKPMTVSEYNQPYPNRYRVEMVHEWAAYGSFHGLDGLMFFTYADDPEPLISKDFVSNFFSISRDPSVMAQFPSCAFAFRNGLIGGAKQPVLVSYSRKDIYNSFEKDNNQRWEKYVPYPLKTQLTHSIRTKTYNSATNYTPSVLPTSATDIFETDTKETLLNTQKGILTTNTPQFIALTGFMNNATNTKVGNLTLTSASTFGSLTWLSLSDKPLVDADTSLITLSSVSQNTGMVWNATNTSINTNWGSEPTAVLPLETTIRLNLNALSVDVVALSSTGQSKSVKTIRPTTTGVFDITLSESVDKTLWYALVLKQTTATNDFSEQADFKVVPNPAHDKIDIIYPISTLDPTVIELFDMTGKNIFYKKIENKSLGEQHETIDVKTIHSGTYLLKIGQKTKKIIIEH